MVKKGRKPGLVKTKTIKKRKLEVYFSTEEEKQELLAKAEKKGMSSSKYILSCLQNMDTGLLSSSPIPNELTQAKNEIRELKGKIEGLEQEKEKLLALVGRNTMELELLRTRDIQLIHEEPVKDGPHEFNKQLIEILKERSEISGIELIELLKVDPKDKEAGRRLWKDLDVLLSHGLIEQTVDGWRWMTQ